VIFISYREGDEPHTVHTIYKRLSQLLKRYKIYFDKNDIVGGSDFRLSIAKQINDSKVIVAPIGKRWLSLLKERQHRELSHPNDWDSIDWLTWELEIALAAHPKKTIIPVHLDSSSRLTEKDLPDRIKDLARKSILTIHQDNDEVFEDGIRKLAVAIRKHIQATEEPSPSVWQKLVNHLFRLEERLWSFATLVGNSLLERYSRLRPQGSLVSWVRGIPLDLCAAVLPIALCFRYYLAENSEWVDKFGAIVGNVGASVIGCILAFITPYSPINVAVYLQNQDDGLSRSTFRILRGLAGAAIVFEMPLMYFWIWRLNQSGRIPWFDQAWNFLF
jgi:hypothetical protein